ncbi:MAG: hypothetical protein JSW59_05730 [Phycisphaerales bacterium]|nr:MAG: hypothetical protein JSW59_05730 [Phycisphaerales bacterium]
MESCGTTIRFRCMRCGAKVKAPDEYAGRQGRCPECRQPVTIPLTEEPSWLLGGITKVNTGKRNGFLRGYDPHVGNARGILGSEKPSTSGTFPTRMKRSKNHEQVSANAAHALHFSVVDALEVSRLRREYKELQKRRQVYNRVSLAFAVPGFILLFFHYLPMFDWHSLKTAGPLWLGSVLMITIGFGYHAKYRGRSFLLGPLLGCFGVVGLVVLKDALKERMQQIGAVWSTMVHNKEIGRDDIGACSLS